MKRRLWALSLLLWAAGPLRADAAFVNKAIPAIRSGPSAPGLARSLKPKRAPCAPTPASPEIKRSPPALPAPSQGADSANREAPAEAVAARAARSFDGSAAETASPKALRLVITGPPGSGKGTFSERISNDYGLAHISAGELLRAYAKSRPKLAATMAAGRLVDSRLVLRLMRERLAKPDAAERGFILDGFPRRRREAEALKRMLGPAGLDGVILLQVPQKELLRRVLARGRNDDRAAVFRERMRIYREQTVPAAKLLLSAAPALRPEVSGPNVAANYARVRAALAGLVKRLRSL